MRVLLALALCLAACDDGTSGDCARDSDCARGVCRGGVCLRYPFDAGVPFDPRDAGTPPPRAMDAGP